MRSLSPATPIPEFAKRGMLDCSKYIRTQWHGICGPHRLHTHRGRGTRKRERVHRTLLIQNFRKKVTEEGIPRRRGVQNLYGINADLRSAWTTI